jgi:cytochrome c biogenesis protein
MSLAAAHRPTLRQSLALAWRSLRSMRTALVLLLILALASVAGSLVPQVGTADARIAATFRDHPLRAAIYDRIGLFDVFGSWWFTLIYSLLLVSLVACLIPRTRALVRNLRARPQPPRELETMRHVAVRTVARSPDRAIADARRLLRRRLFRVRSSSTGGGGMTNGSTPRAWVAADKGLAREVGSLLFHWAFLLILVGIVWGKGTGFTGQAVIVEGQTWTETLAGYDGQIREGRFFGGDHSGIRITVDRFSATYRIPSGIPRDFVTTAELSRADGTPAGSVNIRVNHPAELDGVKIYQFGYGWAPVIRVERDGRPLVSGPIVCSQGPPPADVSPLQLPWDCVVKLPTLQPQVGIRMELWPDIRGLNALLSTGQPMPMFGAFSPVMTYTAYRGDLRTDLALPSDTLDTSAMRAFDRGALGAGRSVSLGDGLTMSFPDLKRYTVLEVKRDRGLGILLAAAILILAGLLPALYTSRRKLWVTAEPVPGVEEASLLRIGGFALQRRPQFEEEFDAIVRALAPPVATARADRPPSAGPAGDAAPADGESLRVPSDQASGPPRDQEEART